MSVEEVDQELKLKKWEKVETKDRSAQEILRKLEGTTRELVNQCDESVREQFHRANHFNVSVIDFFIIVCLLVLQRR